MATLTHEPGKAPHVAEGPSSVASKDTGETPAAVVVQDIHVAKFAAHEAKVREAVVKQEHARLVRDQLVHCYRKYGMNHRSRCKGIAQSYLDAIKGFSPYSNPPQ